MAPSMFAIQMGTVAIGFAAFDLTGSATVLGGVSLAQGVPMLLLSLVGHNPADQGEQQHRDALGKANSAQHRGRTGEVERRESNRNGSHLDRKHGGRHAEPEHPEPGPSEGWTSLQ